MPYYTLYLEVWYPNEQSENSEAVEAFVLNSSNINLYCFGVLNQSKDTITLQTQYNWLW